jgi:RNA polymerase sigma-70 factor (ECF subfamily)
VAYVRSLPSPLPEPPAGSQCLDAFDRELTYLYATLRRLGARSEDIEDLLQDIFVVLHRQWPNLDLSRSIRPWLFGVAFRVLLTHRRRRMREIPRDGLDPQDVSLDPESQAQSQELIALVWAGLDAVPEPRRIVVTMHDVEGLDVVEIARRLSITKFGVYARLHKGRKELASAVRRLKKERVRT